MSTCMIVPYIEHYGFVDFDANLRMIARRD